MKHKIFWLIVLLTIGLRIPLLTSIPPALSVDEAGIGYNAYSILKTNKDEHGVGPFPIAIKSFGDFKAPGTHYLLIPFISKFGLSPESIRLPTAILSIISIIAVYYLTLELFGNQQLSLITAFLLTISPWHIFISRTAYEPMNALVFGLVSLVAILMSRKRKFLFFIGLLFMAISIFTYTAPILLLPIIITLTLYIFRHQFFNKSRQNIILILSFIISVLIIVIISIKYSSEKSQTTVFHAPITIQTIHHRLDLISQQQIPQIISRSVVNKYDYIFKSVINSYLAAYKPDFLFYRPDANITHSLGHLGFGNFYLFFLPLFILGFIIIFREYQQPAYRWIIGYVLISPLITALSIDSPVMHRLLDFHIALTIISAIGLVKLISWLKNSKFYLLGSFLISIIIFISTYQYIFYYFFIFPRSSHHRLYTNLDKAIAVISAKADEFAAIYVSPQIHLNYIYFAFFTPFAPSDFQTHAQRTSNGYNQVATYHQYHFNDIPTNESLCHDFSSQPQTKIALIGKPTSFSKVTPTKTVNIPNPDKYALEPAWTIKVVNLSDLSCSNQLN